MGASPSQKIFFFFGGGALCSLDGMALESLAAEAALNPWAALGVAGGSSVHLWIHDVPTWDLGPILCVVSLQVCYVLHWDE